MRRRTILRFGAAGTGVRALALLADWWQIDSSGASDQAGQRTLATYEWVPTIGGGHR